MKLVEKKMAWTATILVAGLILFGTQMARSGDYDFTTGFAVGITGVSIIRLIQLYRIAKNPSLLKKYEIGQKEERAITLAEKSGRFTLLVTILGEFLAIFTLILLNKNNIATIVSYVAAIQTIVYLVTYYFLSQKY
ncbi:MAG: hypothetical protein PHI24_12705 [Desulfitobacteriaceae bacterium]|nr:hypothetical protein [Desulfitobacteriaceae bacterium]